MKVKIPYLFLFLLISLLFISCSKDNPVNPVVSENEQIIEYLKATTDSVINSCQIAGICAIVIDRNKGINWLYAVGYSDIPGQKKISLDNTFRIGSVTKTMVATVVLQLIDEEKLSLTDKVSRFFPQYPAADTVTIAMLLNMTSGIYNYTDLEFLNGLESNPFRVWTPQEQIDLAFSHGYIFTPGAKNNYSNSNYILLGLIIEKITGSTLKIEIEKRIVEKLGLTNTGFLTSGTTFPGENAKGYYYGPYIENDEYTNRYDISWAWAAGSAYSTPRDLIKYAEALVKGGLVSQYMQKNRLNNYFTPEDPITDYGLGLKRFGSFYGHTGGLAGYQTNMFHSNEKNTTLIVLYNSTLMPHNPYQLTTKFINRIYGEDYAYEP